MPGPLKGPGKFWNIDPIWGYILLILATNCAFWFSLYFQFDQTFLTPPFSMENFLVPPSSNSKLFWPPSILPSPPTRVFMNAPLWNKKCLQSGGTEFIFTQIYIIYQNESKKAKCVCFVNSPLTLKTRFLAC